jgi:hypothetical protein
MKCDMLTLHVVDCETPLIWSLLLQAKPCAPGLHQWQARMAVHRFDTQKSSKRSKFHVKFGIVRLNINDLNVMQTKQCRGLTLLVVRDSCQPWRSPELNETAGSTPIPGPRLTLKLPDDWVVNRLKVRRRSLYFCPPPPYGIITDEADVLGAAVSLELLGDAAAPDSGSVTYGIV